MKISIVESEDMITDYFNCSSDISKMYLAAAIKKHFQKILSFIPSGFTE
jgi:hypothetical protein